MVAQENERSTGASNLKDFASSFEPNVTSLLHESMFKTIAMTVQLLVRHGGGFARSALDLVFHIFITCGK